MIESKMTLTFVDCEGNVTTKEFSPETWVNALSEFVKFLKGCGYWLSNDSIGVNKTRHPYITEEDVYDLAKFDL